MLRASTPSRNDSKRRAIDAKVHGTLSKLYANVRGSRELVDKANGVLVFPSVIKVETVLVAGGNSTAKGALRVGGKSVGYYSTVSGSFGLQAGAQSKAVIFLFMTHDALNSFRHSKGWSVWWRRVSRALEGRRERCDRYDNGNRTSQCDRADQCRSDGRCVALGNQGLATQNLSAAVAAFVLRGFGRIREPNGGLGQSARNCTKSTNTPARCAL